MEEVKKTEKHLTSAVAFVEGGIQEACDDACSICLEAFSETDPSTVTTCKHEFHLQCILEWCQRSAQCPMCWQPISLKDPSSQELLAAIEQERSFRFKPSRNAPLFRHPALRDFELQHLPVGADDAELEERIIQHLAAAAAMGRPNHHGRREGHRNRLSALGHPNFLVFSTNPSSPRSHPVSASLAQVEAQTEPTADNIARPSIPLTIGESEPSESSQTSASATVSNVMPTNQHGFLSNTRTTAFHSQHASRDMAGPSEQQSLSESLKSRFNAMSMRYKETISKSTRGWKERLFSRNTSMKDVGSEVRRDVNAGIANVSHMTGPAETTISTPGHASARNNVSNASVTEHRNQSNSETHAQDPKCDNDMSTSSASSVTY